MHVKPPVSWTIAPLFVIVTVFLGAACSSPNHDIEASRQSAQTSPAPSVTGSQPCPPRPSALITPVQASCIIGANGAPHTFTATEHEIFETWLETNGSMYTRTIISTEDRIVGFATMQVSNSARAIYVAVTDGVWELYWTSGDPAPHSIKIIKGLVGVEQITAMSRPQDEKWAYYLLLPTSSGDAYEALWVAGGSITVNPIKGHS